MRWQLETRAVYVDVVELNHAGFAMRRWMSASGLQSDLQHLLWTSSADENRPMGLKNLKKPQISGQSKHQQFEKRQTFERSDAMMIMPIAEAPLQLPAVVIIRQDEAF